MADTLGGSGIITVMDHDELFDDPWALGLIDEATRLAIVRALGQRLYRARVERHWTLGEVATRCDSWASTISRIENCTRPPNLIFLFKLCGVLGLRPSDVLRDAEDAAVPLAKGK